jgi:hypothetical protein
VSEAGENAKFLMTIASLVTVFWPADALVAVAPDAEVPVGEGVLVPLELLLEQAVSAATRTSPGTHSQLQRLHLVMIHRRRVSPDCVGRGRPTPIPLPGCYRRAVN